MDPWLEDPLLWPGVHDFLIVCAATALNRSLRPRYVARIQERVYVVRPEQNFLPDVTVELASPARRRKGRPRGATAVADASDPCWEVSLGPYEVRESYVEIRPARERGSVITVLEFLSPTNKLAGSEGRQNYLDKQRQILASPIHLLEVDLLRRGVPTAVASSPDRLLRQGPYDYLVCLSRSGRRDRCEVWGFTMRQRLPRVHVPLAQGEDDVVLDLQAVFDRAYDDGAYADDTDYTVEPVVPLRQVDAEWADALLRKKGHRKKRRPRGRNGG
jgi:hypothetical protein